MMQPPARSAISLETNTSTKNKFMIYEECTKYTQNFQCPKCGQVGNFVKHGTYNRHLVTLFEKLLITMQRLKCCSCNKTHAIIPEDVIPYKSLSIDMTASMASDWLNGLSNSKIRQKYALPESTRRRYMSTIQDFFTMLYGAFVNRMQLLEKIPDNFEATIYNSSIVKLHRKFCEHVRLNNLQVQVNWDFWDST